MARQTATQVARKNIAKLYRREFCLLREMEFAKEQIPRFETSQQKSARYSRAGSRAKTLLANKYPEKYKELFDIAKEDGYPASAVANPAKELFVNQEPVVVLKGIGSAVWDKKCGAYHIKISGEIQ